MPWFSPITNTICHHFIHPPTTGYICQPLVVQGETLSLFYLETPKGLTPDQVVNWNQKAVTVGEGIKISLSNLKLRELMHRQANQLLVQIFTERGHITTQNLHITMLQLGWKKMGLFPRKFPLSKIMGIQLLRIGAIPI